MEAAVLEPIIAKRVSNLSKLKADSTLYYQRDRNYDEDGEPMDEKFSTSSQALIGSMHNLTPHWDSEANRWAWFGDLADLKRIAKTLALADLKTRQTIVPDESSLTNKYDPFFGHPTLWNSMFIEESSKYITSETPIEEFYNRVLRGREDVKQPDRDDQSIFMTEGSKIEIISPRDEQRTKSKNVDEELVATGWLIKLIADDNALEKLDRIAYIADLQGYEEAKLLKVDGLKTIIKNELVDNTQVISKYGMTARKYFLFMSELLNEDLEVLFTSSKAVRHGFIRRDAANGYSFKGEKLREGLIKSDKDLYTFLKDDANIKTYMAIEDALSAIGK